ncbi:Zf-FLZ domain [Abeliophyllum distichum]|uniref:Zf-FLZ domain n=1 Tax=Abeliophyllum distichum TaxID=126358 RepID=A0ABD1STV4_9LAMI
MADTPSNLQLNSCKPLNEVPKRSSSYASPVQYGYRRGETNYSQINNNLFHHCAFCKGRIRLDRDIHMYTDKPFCSVRCRFNQIYIDYQTDGKDQMAAPACKKKAFFTIF